MVDITQVTQNINPQNINFSGVPTILWQGVTWGLSALALGFVVYVVWQYLKYNISVTLLFKTGDGTGFQSGHTKGYINKKKNTFETLGYKNIDLPIPDDKYIMQKKPRGREAFARIINLSGTWVHGISDNPHFIPADYNMQHHLIKNIKMEALLLQPESKFWDKYGHQILWGFTIVIALLMILFILQRMDKVIDVANGLLNKAVSTTTQTI